MNLNCNDEQIDYGSTDTKQYYFVKNDEEDIHFEIFEKANLDYIKYSAKLYFIDKNKQ